MTDYIFTGETLDGEIVEGDLVHDGQDRTYILMDVMDHINRDDYSVYMVEVRPSSVRLNTEIICDQAEQIDNLKAEVERLRGDGWISVKERSPELYEDVLVYGKNFNHRWSNDTEPDRFYVARYCGDTCGWTIPGIGGLTITHWRPLPEPPRGE